MNAGGFNNQVKQGKIDKEKFSKKLNSLQFYNSAQCIFAHLLSMIQIQFNCFVLPKIQSNADKEEILNAIGEKIIEYVRNKLGQNVLDIFSDEINGMLYYLTGNCHINWK